MSDKAAAPIEFQLYMDESPLDDGLDDDSVADPVLQMFERAALIQELSKGGLDPVWNAPIGGVEKRADEVEEEVRHVQDGVELEKCGSSVWRHTYKAGKYAGSTVEDPALPAPHRMIFDAEGNQIVAA